MNGMNGMGGMNGIGGIGGMNEFQQLLALQAVGLGPQLPTGVANSNQNPATAAAAAAAAAAAVGFPNNAGTFGTLSGFPQGLLPGLFVRQSPFTELSGGNLFPCQYMCGRLGFKPRAPLACATLVTEQCFPAYITT